MDLTPQDFVLVENLIWLLAAVGGFGSGTGPVLPRGGFGAHSCWHLAGVSMPLGRCRGPQVGGAGRVEGPLVQRRGRKESVAEFRFGDVRSFVRDVSAFSTGHGRSDVVVVDGLDAGLRVVRVSGDQRLVFLPDGFEIGRMFSRVRVSLAVVVWWAGKGFGFEVSKRVPPTARVQVDFMIFIRAIFL